MARKNLLSSVTAALNAENGEDTSISNSEVRASYAKRGASRSMIQSLDDLAETSLKILDGETVVSLDTSELDGSFVADRIGEDDEDYVALRDAIQTSGQFSPILVRPHPDDAGRYMIVFGHRRAKVARELGIRVRAVIKQIADIEHVIAQGQENTARADLSFIEKALFARNLLQSGMSKDVIKTALTVDDTLLSRMLSVAEIIPIEVLKALGASKGVGRDRWEELKKRVLKPTIAAKAKELISSPQFIEADDKFTFLLTTLKMIGKTPKKTLETPINTWRSKDNSVRFSMSQKPKKISIELSEKSAEAFGRWISENLDTLFQNFRQSEPKTGD
ncbi:plasmid partitioning protein RepB [Brucella thiophenivorans]|uniref:Plasmid partitioning protein RepB n=1 Tax=Brucella thiophenivorans TaxID=571255 RepID=A0A256FBN8_9HYPH|nr:plasmid partitioning protein RepB [Brucella thiophenivorans]OYR12228.1 plasmid partitioning protein RepB [Brucella thiophenivorans]